MKEQKLGYGISIQGFSTFEEMDDFLAESEREAIANTLPEQWQITWGSYVVRVVERLVIFGIVYTEEQFLNTSLKGEAEYDEEIRAELDDLRAAHERGYRYGRWFSEVEPDGEYGSAHVVNLWRITEEDFVAARHNGWHLNPDLIVRMHKEISAARREADRGQDRPEGDG